MVYTRRISKKMSRARFFANRAHLMQVGGGRRINWTYKRPAKIPYEKVLGPRLCHPGVTMNGESCIPATAIQSQGANTRAELCQRLGAADDDLALLKVLPPDVRKDWTTRYFRPKAPESWNKDPDDWLDNHSIEAVLKQYEQADPTFVSLGAVPIDFAAPDPYSQNAQKCLLPEFCKINMAELRAKGKKGIGMVFNLDPHFKDGSHWISMYVDLIEPAAYYFDSYGYPPPKQVKLLMQSLWKQDNKCKLAYNGRRFQYSASECGVYSIYFVICMHYGIKFNHFVKHRVKDDVMLFLRSWFWNVGDVVET
jgi:hypothetical protein